MDDNPRTRKFKVEKPGQNGVQIAIRRHNSLKTGRLVDKTKLDIYECVVKSKSNS